MTRLDIVMRAAREAGDLALTMRGVDLAFEMKDDDSPVTAADLAAQEIIVERLTRAFPDAGLIGEEDASIAPKSGAGVFAVDPIDGTDSFRSGYPHWGVSIGLVEEGRCTLGVFYAPVLGEMYAVDTGAPATLNGRPLAPLAPDNRWGPFIAPSDFHRHFATDYPGKLRGYGTMAYHLCYVAAGLADGTMGFDSHIWDYAGGLAILESVGGRFASLDGRPFKPADWIDGRKVTIPHLAAPAAKWDRVRDRIRAREAAR
ncbi:inositol monophosphatase [bacterium]|nr:inositol monophosphatase [bacterium]